MNKLQRPLLKTVIRTVPVAARAEYRVARVASEPRLLGDLARRPWAAAQVAQVDRFHPASSAHRPVTLARLVHTARALHVDFSVQDRYVRAVQTEYQSLVSRDSCVELFLQPPGTKAYFNFELNCIGVMLLYFITDPRKDKVRVFRSATPVPAKLGKRVKVASSLSGPIEQELASATAWRVSARIPIELITEYVPKVSRFTGGWRGNFFKCGDETSQPHWAAWCDIGARLRFHQPARFGSIVFE